MVLLVESERETTMQMPPFIPPAHEYDKAEVEAQEQELKEDYTGLPPRSIWPIGNR